MEANTPPDHVSRADATRRIADLLRVARKARKVHRHALAMADAGDDILARARDLHAATWQRIAALALDHNVVLTIDQNATAAQPTS
jgi:hypothetical protein